MARPPMGLPLVVASTVLGAIRAVGALGSIESLAPALAPSRQSRRSNSLWSGSKSGACATAGQTPAGFIGARQAGPLRNNATEEEEGRWP
jgi:hypothetical protein